MILRFTQLSAVTQDTELRTNCMGLSCKKHSKAQACQLHFSLAYCMICATELLPCMGISLSICSGIFLPGSEKDQTIHFSKHSFRIIFRISQMLHCLILSAQSSSCLLSSSICEAFKMIFFSCNVQQMDICPVWQYRDRTNYGNLVLVWCVFKSKWAILKRNGGNLPASFMTNNLNLKRNWDSLLW